MLKTLVPSLQVSCSTTPCRWPSRLLHTGEEHSSGLGWPERSIVVSHTTPASSPPRACFFAFAPTYRQIIPLVRNIWRVRNIANMLYFAQMVIFLSAPARATMAAIRHHKVLICTVLRCPPCRFNQQFPLLRNQQSLFGQKPNSGVQQGRAQQSAAPMKKPRCVATTGFLFIQSSADLRQRQIRRCASAEHGFVCRC